jgi:hypothetical protein
MVKVNPCVLYLVCRNVVMLVHLDIVYQHVVRGPHVKSQIQVGSLYIGLNNIISRVFNRTNFVTNWLC